MEVKFDISKLKKVPIGDIFPNEYNPKDKDTEEYKIIKQSIQEKGMLDIIFVRWRENIDGKQTYWIVDGEQRWTACSELEYKELIVYDYEDMPEIEAQQRTLIFQAQVPMNVIKLAQLVKAMKETQESIFLPFTDKELTSMTSLATYQFKDLTAGVNMKPEVMLQNTVLSIPCSIDQKRIIDQAIEKVRNHEGDVSDARALELICIEFINMPEGQTGLELQPKQQENEPN